MKNSKYAQYMMPLFLGKLEGLKGKAHDGTKYNEYFSGSQHNFHLMSGCQAVDVQRDASTMSKHSAGKE